MKPLPCPFIYKDGRRCPGHIVRIEAYKADLRWSLRDDGAWVFDLAQRSHFHLFCSAKGNHAGVRRRDDPQMKFFWNHLPEEVLGLVSLTGVRANTGEG
ncbi:MAG: hypothetical protein ACE5GS_06630 [Kiloniellaceae bacterium]